MTTEQTYRHAEAYCLMRYRADDGSEKEIIWNSRDGVTPFVITLRSGKQATHVDWASDQRVPGYKPPVGSRMFVDLTEEAAHRSAERNAAEYFADPGPAGQVARDWYESPGAMAEALFEEYYRPGAPSLVEVTAEEDAT